MAEVLDRQIPVNFPVRFEPVVLDSPDGQMTADFARIDLPKARESDIARNCGEAAAIAKAAQIRAAAGPVTADWDWAVYVVATPGERASKIGVTASPARRLVSVQNGSAERLRFSHLFWMPRKAAYGIERMALRIAARMGKRMMGEWVGMSSDEAGMVVATLLKCSTVSVSSSAMFCENIRQAFSEYDQHYALGYARPASCGFDVWSFAVRG